MREIGPCVAIAAARVWPVLAIMVAGCQEPTPNVVCVPLGPAVTVTVRDSVTSAPAATGARGVAVRAGIVDSLRVVEPSVMVSQEGAREGTFDVRIEKAGYFPWTATLVAPRGGVCGSPGARSEARLQRVGAE